MIFSQLFKKIYFTLKRNSASTRKLNFCSSTWRGGRSMRSRRTWVNIVKARSWRKLIVAMKRGHCVSKTVGSFSRNGIQKTTTPQACKSRHLTMACVHGSPQSILKNTLTSSMCSVSVVTGPYYAFFEFSSSISCRLHSPKLSL